MTFSLTLPILLLFGAVIYRWQQAVPPLVKKILVFLNFAYTLLVLNYSCVGFMVSYFSLPPRHIHIQT